MHGQVQRLGHLVLDLGRVLGRAVHDHVAIVLWQRGGSLTFEVEMFLTTKFNRPPLYDVRGLRKGILHVPPVLPDDRPVFEPAVGGERLVNGHDCGQGGVMSILASRAALRAARWDVAATMNIG